MSRSKRPPIPPLDRDARDDGFVLIAVLGGMLILALIAASLLLSARSQIKLRAAAATQAELSAIADGVVRLAAVKASQAQSEAMQLDGTPTWCREGKTVVRLEVNDVAGLVDINLAPPEVLEILLAGLGTARGDAKALAAAIIDFRDANEVVMPGGAEAPEYASAGRSYGPKNAPFDTVEELDQVLGMTPELLQRMRPLVTVHNKSTTIDVSLAPLTLLQALTVGNPARTEGTGGSPLIDRAQFEPPRQLLTRAAARGAARGRRRAFVIGATASNGPQAAFRRLAVIEVAPQAETGLQVQEWIAPALAAPLDRSPAAAGSLPPCFPVN